MKKIGKITKFPKSFFFWSLLAFVGIVVVFSGMVSSSALLTHVYAQPLLGADRTWSFTYFGPTTGEAQNRLLSSPDGIKESVSIGSAIFNEDGTVNTKGGKFVADSPADGGSYFYTEIDPSKENFILQADVTVDQMNPTPDGQEGFALMVRDALWTDHSKGSCMSNLMSVTGTKLPIGGINKGTQVKDTIGFRGYSGIVTPEGSEENDISAFRYGWWKNSEGEALKIAQGECYRVRLEKTSNAYIGTQYAIGENGETGEVLGSYAWYVPAIDHNAETIGSYEELDDPLSVQERDKAYVALVAARGMNVTFSNILFETSEWKASEWRPQPEVLIQPVLLITSSSTTGDDTYELSFKTNADGMAAIYRGDQVIEGNIRVNANTLMTKQYDLLEDETTFLVFFTPDPDYRISAFERLSDYTPQTASFTVQRRKLGTPEGDIIYVKKDGLSFNSGTSMDDAVDLQTALFYARPGQTILLKSEKYYFTEGSLKIERGRNGREDTPITLTTEEGDNAVFDFDHKGAGFECAGNYWHMSRINITNTADMSHGMLLSGSHNVLTGMNFYNNGLTGLQISGSSLDEKRLWPSYNSVINCTSMNNADKSLEDADGFACKLTSGEGNVFDGCIAAYNADDGFDLFAKIATGSIGKVMIKNSVVYKNGYLRVKEGGTTKNFELADIRPGQNGNLLIEESVEMEAGNGSGFKMGGSNLPGDHCLQDSISYENKGSGIDSNSGPNIAVFRCVSFNNDGPNISLSTHNNTAITAYVADRVVSYRKGGPANISDAIRLQGQKNSEIWKDSNYFWDENKQCSTNSSGSAVKDDWFYSLDTSTPPERGQDGKIDMHGLLCLKKSNVQFKAPTAKTLTFNGAAQELVAAGKAEGGTMQYAFGVNATTAPQAGYSTSIPVATDVGTYYVWYRVVGDFIHTDYGPKCLVVKIAPNNGELNTTKQSAKKALVNYYNKLLKDKRFITRNASLLKKAKKAADNAINGAPSVKAVKEAYKVAKANLYNIKIKTKVPLVAAKVIAQGDKSLKVSWNRVYGASRYVVYLKYCNSNNKKTSYKKIKTTNANTFSVVKSNLKKNTAYKCVVVAQKKVGSSYKTVATSKTAHSFTSNVKGSFTNPRSITLNKRFATLKVGASTTITAKINNVVANKKIPTSHAPALRFTSTNPEIASVNSSGVVTAKNPGKALICVQTINGIWESVAVFITPF